MGLFNTQNRQRESKFQKTEFLAFTPGEHVVRLLGDPRTVAVHFFRGRGSVECLGKDCPVCKNNSQIRMEHPKDAHKVPGYNAKSWRNYINVLDRTLSKTCANCDETVKQDSTGRFPATCPSCNAFISEIKPTPANKIKVLNISETNAARLDLFDQRTLDAETEMPIGIRNFDITFMVTSVGDKKDITPVPNVTSRDVINTEGMELYDLENVVIKLTPEEMINFAGGVSLKDIFAARSSGNQTVSDDDVDDIAIENLKESIESLLN